jgi:hypothetical protein
MNNVMPFETMGAKSSNKYMKGLRMKPCLKKLIKVVNVNNPMRKLLCHAPLNF